MFGDMKRVGAAASVGRAAWMRAAGLLLAAACTAVMLVFSAGAVILAQGVCAPLQAWAAGAPELQDSFPVDGAVDVPCQGRFWLQFSNAVASVETNQDLVTVAEAGGRKVSRKHWAVSLPDFELEFGYRQYIYLDMTALKPGTKYVIRVAKGITAKNGAVSDKTAEIYFTTAKEGTAPMACVEPEPVEGGSGNGGGNGGGQGGGNGGNGSQAGSGQGGNGGGQGGASGDAQVSDSSQELAGHMETGADGVTEIHLDASGRQPYRSDGQAQRQKGELVLCHYTVGGVGSDTNQGDVSPEPGLAYFATLQFTGMVCDFDESSDEYQANLAKVWLQKADGTRVSSAETYGYRNGNESVVIYISISDWLEPLTNYQVVCEPGVVDPQGNQTQKRYVIDFTTDDETSAGIPLIPLGVGILVAAALVLGLVIQARRQRANKR